MKSDYKNKQFKDVRSGMLKCPVRFNDMRKRILMDLQYLSEYDVPFIVEFGSGEKLYSSILKCFGYDVFTVDISNDFKPDMIADITTDLQQLKQMDIDFIVAHHLLEHIPYDKALKCIGDFSKLLNNGGILSLAIPNRRYWFRVGLKIPKLIDRDFNLYLYRKSFVSAADKKNHLWEIDSGHRLNKLRQQLQDHFTTVRLVQDDMESYFIAKKL